MADLIYLSIYVGHNQSEPYMYISTQQVPSSFTITVPKALKYKQLPRLSTTIAKLGIIDRLSYFEAL